MAIAPINITRISQGMKTLTLLESMRRNSMDVFNQQIRLATGRKNVSISDDPVSASQALKMNVTLDRQGQILENLRHADLMMSASDEALNEVNTLLNEAEGLASQSLGTQSNTAEREANAALVASIRERLMIVGNREIRGSFIFAGRETQTTPFVSALGGVAYLGDEGSTFSRVGETDQAATNVPGNLLFGSLSTRVGAGADLQPTLTRETRLTDLQGANALGIRRGTVVIEGSGGTSFPVDLSTADTVGDVIDMIGDAALSAGITADVAVSGNSLTVSGGATITDVANGVTASDLGFTTSGVATAQSQAVNLRPRLTPNTTIASLNSGRGLNLDDSFIIRNGLESAVIDLTGVTTVQDLTNRINTAGVFVTAGINEAGTGVEIVSQVSGVTMSISDNGGTIAADMGLRTMVSTTPLSSLNFGRGVEILEGEPDLTITSRDGSSFDVNLDGAETVGDVISLMNQAASDAGVNVKAGLSADSNGIVLEDTTSGTGALTVSRARINAFAVEDLGLDKSVTDPEALLISDDVGQVRAEGILTALVDLERALLADDQLAIGEVAERIVKFSADTTRVHGVVGAKAQGIRSRVDQTENAVLVTQNFLSQIEDLDYTEAITEFQQAQTALQANLLSGSQILNLSLLDFIG